jgi:hypothetical protein
VTGGGEPLPEHVARCDPSSTRTAGPEWKGMSLATRELPRILHSVASSQGYRVFAGRSWPHGWWSDWVPGLPLGSWNLFGGASDGECVFSCLGPRQAVGAVRRFGTVLLGGLFSWPVRASFGSEELGLLRRRSWALSPPKRGGVRMSGGPGAKRISVSSRFFGLPCGASGAGAFRFLFPLRQDRSEAWGALRPCGCWPPGSPD